MHGRGRAAKPPQRPEALDRGVQLHYAPARLNLYRRVADEAARDTVTMRPRSHYSAFTLLKEGLSGQAGWQPAWTSPDPRPSYDAIVVGGGGHGLATAYYLAKNHGLGRVAVLRGDESMRRADGRAADTEGLHQALVRKRKGALGCGSRIGTLKRCALALAA